MRLRVMLEMKTGKLQVEEITHTGSSFILMMLSTDSFFLFNDNTLLLSSENQPPLSCLNKEVLGKMAHDPITHGYVSEMTAQAISLNQVSHLLCPIRFLSADLIVY